MSPTAYSTEEMADRLAIQDTISKYVWALDEHDYDVMDDIFLPDTHFDMTSSGGIDALWSPDVKEYFKANLPLFEHYIHTFTNILITFGPERQTASSRSKVLNPMGIRDEKGDMRHFENTGEYRDQWRKTDDGWRITSRLFLQSHIWGDYPFQTLPGEFDKR